jgi:hypothetical protein
MEISGKITDLKDVFKIMRDLNEEISTNTSANAFIYGINPESFPYGLWFRGEGDHEPPLVPKAFRILTGRNRSILEPAVVNHMQARLPILYQIGNPFDKLCVAQHHGIPTRLLDWTESVLVATFFAVISGGQEWRNRNANLFILNTFTLNHLSGLGDGKGKMHVSTDYGTLFRAEIAYSFNRRDWSQRIAKFYPTFKWDQHSHDLPCNLDRVPFGDHVPAFEQPVAVLPPRLDQRMIVQSAAFTLHGGSMCWGNEDLPKLFPELFVSSNISREIVRKYSIDCEDKAKIKKQLFWLGIHNGVLFPEMDHQAEFLETVC